MINWWCYLLEEHKMEHSCQYFCKMEWKLMISHFCNMKFEAQRRSLNFEKVTENIAGCRGSPAVIIYVAYNYIYFSYYLAPWLTLYFSVKIFLAMFRFQLIPRIFLRFLPLKVSMLLSRFSVNDHSSLLYRNTLATYALKVLSLILFEVFWLLRILLSILYASIANISFGWCPLLYQ